MQDVGTRPFVTTRISLPEDPTFSFYVKAEYTDNNEVRYSFITNTKNKFFTFQQSKANSVNKIAQLFTLVSNMLPLLEKQLRNKIKG